MSSIATHAAGSRLPVEPLVLPPQAPELSLSKVYVWQVPVRVAHWLIFFSIVVLSATGVYIGHPFLVSPGPARGEFIMGTVRTVHLYAAIVFTLAVLSRIAWMFLGNRYSHWDKLIPVRRRRFKGILPTLKFYLFMLRKPPGFIGHNPVAGLAYTVVFLVYLVMVITGLTLYSAYAPVGSVFRWLTVFIPTLGGLQHARLFHHVGMWLLLGFAVHHVYSALLMSHVEQRGDMESIFSGYKFVSREDVVHSGYRFLEPEPARADDAEERAEERKDVDG